MGAVEKKEGARIGKADSHLVAWRLLLTVHAVLKQRFSEGLDDGTGISYDDYDVLVTLNEAAGERLRLSELAELTLFSHSGMSRCVTRLEADGLIRREKCETDGRGYYACLTKAGRNALLEKWPKYRRLIERDFSSKMTTDEAEVLARLMNRLISTLDDSRFLHVYPNRMTDAPP